MLSRSSAPLTVSNKKEGTPKAQLPSNVRTILKDWLMSPEHFANPYPNPAEKVRPPPHPVLSQYEASAHLLLHTHPLLQALLLEQTGIELKQLTNWFTNARKRIWKPLVANSPASTPRVKKTQPTKRPAPAWHFDGRVTPPSLQTHVQYQQNPQEAEPQFSPHQSPVSHAWASSQMFPHEPPSFRGPAEQRPSDDAHRCSDLRGSLHRPALLPAAPSADVHASLNAVFYNSDAASEFDQNLFEDTMLSMDFEDFAVAPTTPAPAPAPETAPAPDLAPVTSAAATAATAAAIAHAHTQTATATAVDAHAPRGDALPPLLPQQPLPPLLLLTSAPPKPAQQQPPQQPQPQPQQQQPPPPQQQQPQEADLAGEEAQGLPQDWSERAQGPPTGQRQDSRKRPREQEQAQAQAQAQAAQEQVQAQAQGQEQGQEQAQAQAHGQEHGQEQGQAQGQAQGQEQAVERAGGGVGVEGGADCSQLQRGGLSKRPTVTAGSASAVTAVAGVGVGVGGLDGCSHAATSHAVLPPPVGAAGAGTGHGVVAQEVQVEVEAGGPGHHRNLTLQCQ
jgi:hypothetical protein